MQVKRYFKCKFRKIKECDVYVVFFKYHTNQTIQNYNKLYVNGLDTTGQARIEGHFRALFVIKYIT